MTGAEFEQARQALGLSAADCGRALELTGRDPGRTVRLWETGQAGVPGPAAVAMRLLVREAKRTRAPGSQFSRPPVPELDMVTPGLDMGGQLPPAVQTEAPAAPPPPLDTIPAPDRPMAPTPPARGRRRGPAA